MKKDEILHRRLLNQQIGFTRFTDPVQILSWLAAMQAQEYQMAKWAIGLRLGSGLKGTSTVNDNDIEKLFNEGRILRTHLLRPTWHFVSAEDIRWILALTAPRIKLASSFMNRKMDLDDRTFKRSNQIIINELTGGKHKTRDELKIALAKKKITGDGVTMSLLMMRAELDGVICSGPRKGSQFTYALLEERVPSATALDREEALIQLTRRYFISRGPACVQDYHTWSGLTATFCKKGIELLGNEITRINVEGRDYYFFDTGNEELVSWKKVQKTFLMPDYDEYGMSYKERSAFFDPSQVNIALKGGSPVYNRMIVIDGKIRGSWKRSMIKGMPKVETIPFNPLNNRESKDLQRAVKRYQQFIEAH